VMVSQKSAGAIPFMVRYLTTNGKSNTYGLYEPFALRYRRVNGTFYESVKFGYTEWEEGGRESIWERDF